MIVGRAIAWFSCGITSAVAVKLALDKYGKDNVDIYYIEIDTAHPDNERFIFDCEIWYGKKINRVRSKRYADQFEVIEGERYINGPGGAKCTNELKKAFVTAYKKNIITLFKYSALSSA